MVDVEYFIIVVLIGWLIKVYCDKADANDHVRSLEMSIRSQSNQIINQANQYYKNKTLSAQQDSERILQMEQQKLLEIRSSQNYAKKFLHTQIINYPILTSVLADYQTSIDDMTANQLKRKKHPAIKAAEEIRQVKKEKQILIAQNLAYKWELEYIRSLIPELTDIGDNTVASQNVFNPDYDDSQSDAAGYWLTAEEYNSLSTTEKYQRALDRYKHRHKTNKEIGDDYELYIGYLYETAGYDVEYYGMKRGLEDLGRDLICKRGHDIQVVQCKCWSRKKEKVIREKYINQLFGTTFKYYLEQYPHRNASHFIKQLENESDWSIENQIPNIDPLDVSDEDIVTPVFISTVDYSDTAQQFADELYVRCKVIPMGNYPMIKCNINRTTREKIYHLPFDQQYRTCKIDQPGECYATTVAEAEKKGFRRAMRWRGNNPNVTAQSPKKNRLSKRKN